MIKLETVLFIIALLWLREIIRDHIRPTYKQGYDKALQEIINSWNSGIDVGRDDFEKRLHLLQKNIKTMIRKNGGKSE